MHTHQFLDDVDDAPATGRVVAIGVFDGVHRGHQRIVTRAVEESATVGARSSVVTFSPHPDVVLHPRSAPRVLTPPARKASLLEALGVEELIVVRFDHAFASLSPESFCRKVLSHHLDARVVFVGENFRFGHQGKGTVVHLEEYGKTHGFAVRAVPLVDEGGESISSTRIRELLRAGRVEEAADLLGRPHRIEGLVTSGRGRGRALGAPTANLQVAGDTALPRSGVYATRSTVEEGGEHPSVTSLGTNPTFETDRKTRIETLLLGFEGDLYGGRLAVDFLERIRGQKTFADAGALAERIKEDVGIALRIHADRPIFPTGGGGGTSAE